MDYVDVFVVDLKTAFKQFERRLCGNDTPAAYVSVHQQLELEFGVRTKTQGTHTGFAGTYQFVNEGNIFSQSRTPRSLM